MAGENPAPRFRTDPYVTAARFAVAASIVLSAGTVALLIVIEPPKQCLGWRIGNKDSLWTLLCFWSVPLHIFGGYIAICWDKVAQKITKDSNREVRTLFFRLQKPPAVPAEYIMIPMCMMNSAMAQFPLLLLLGACTR